MKFSIRLLYLYLFSFIGLLIAVIGSIQLVDLGLNVYVFHDADIYEYARPVNVEGENKDTEEDKAIVDRENMRQRQRKISSSLAMLIIGIPLYKYHWDLIKKTNKKIN